MHLSNALSSAALGYSASLASSSLPPLLFSCTCASLCNILFLCWQPEPICSKYQPKSIVYRNKPVHWYSPSKVRDKPPKGAPPPSDTHSKASENWINLFFSLPHPPSQSSYHDLLSNLSAHPTPLLQSPQGGRGCPMYFPCLESQGWHSDSPYPISSLVVPSNPVALPALSFFVC